MLKRLPLPLVVLLSFSGARKRLRASAAQQYQARPLYCTRAVTHADLDGRTLRELSLMRNTIYAHAGNPFRKKWLNDYFSAQPCYHPFKTIDQSKITPLDRKNAEAITDYEHKKEDGWFAAA